MPNFKDGLLMEISIDHAIQYECAVRSYSISHRELVIWARRTEDSSEIHDLYFLFEDVLFFEGPTKWSSAKFDVGSLEEQAMLLKGLDGVPETSTDELLTELRLFSVKLSHGTLRILADRRAYVTQQPPEDASNHALK